MAEVAAELIHMRFEQELLPRRAPWDTVIRLAQQAPGWRLLYSALDEAFEAVEQVTKLNGVPA
jgi:hypothetical protein